MSAHFAVLRAAGLIVSDKHGKSVVYQLQLSVLEDALLSFAQSFGWDWLSSKSGVKTSAARGLRL
jgi:hypothetical protein